MPTYICSAEREGVRYYFDYSTVVDAPTTGAMTRREYESYYRSKYGEANTESLLSRLARADARGTSSMLHANLADILSSNRAGPNEERLTVDQVVDLVLSARRRLTGDDA